MLIPVTNSINSVQKNETFYSSANSWGVYSIAKHVLCMHLCFKKVIAKIFECL